MKDNNQSKETKLLKAVYKTPEIQLITLDNEISLILQSATPPYGPGESMLRMNEQHIQNPFGEFC